MNILKFKEKFVDQLKKEPIPRGIFNERGFECNFVLPLALSTCKAESDYWLFAHPWGNKDCCKPNCRSAMDGLGQRVVGCPRCWATSKKWSSVAAFGTHHNFDLVARDLSGAMLAVEIKLVKAKTGRMPNGEIQRFLGQCALASSKFKAVVGVCGYYGLLNYKYNEDTATVTKWAERLGINLVFRSIE